MLIVIRNESLVDSSQCLSESDVLKWRESDFVIRDQNKFSFIYLYKCIYIRYYAEMYDCKDRLSFESISNWNPELSWDRVASLNLATMWVMRKEMIIFEIGLILRLVWQCWNSPYIFGASEADRVGWSSHTVGDWDILWESKRRRASSGFTKPHLSLTPQGHTGQAGAWIIFSSWNSIIFQSISVAIKIENKHRDIIKR